MPRPTSPGLSGPLPRRIRLKRALQALATVLLTSCLQALGTLPALAASQRAQQIMEQSDQGRIAMMIDDFNALA